MFKTLFSNAFIHKNCFSWQVYHYHFIALFCIVRSKNNISNTGKSRRSKRKWCFWHALFSTVLCPCLFWYNSRIYFLNIPALQNESLWMLGTRWVIHPSSSFLPSFLQPLSLFSSFFRTPIVIFKRTLGVPLFKAPSLQLCYLDHK